MSIVICNDDGLHAQGIQTLYQVLSKSFETIVVAPDRDASGISSALTLTRPLHLRQAAEGQYTVDGTPADCGHMAVHHSKLPQFERLISGINSHENLGDDVIYSGTVGAALEGRFLAKPAIAVSLVNQGQHNFASAAQVVRVLLDRNIGTGMPFGTVLNINVPDISFDELKGLRWTRLGRRDLGESPVRTACPRGRERHWIGVAGTPVDQSEGTDFHAVQNGFVSITPISPDMTQYNVLKSLDDFEDLS